MARLARGLATGAIPIGALAAGFRSTPEEPFGKAPSFRAQVVRFAAIGVASTIAYLLLFVALRGSAPAQLANAAALLATAVANTAANRRFTFSVRAREGRLRHQAQGLAIFGAALAVTSGALAALHAAAPHPSRLLEASVLVAANVFATGLRFVLFRTWVFARWRGVPPAHIEPSTSIDRSVPATAATQAGGPTLRSLP